MGLRDWLARRKAERARQLFEYFDGARVVRRDPLRILRDYHADPHYSEERHAEAVQEGDPEATELFLACAARVLGLHRYDHRTGRGLTDNQVGEAMTRFWDYVESVAKKPAAGPTSSPNTGGVSAGATAAHVSTTNSCSDCGCTPSVPETDARESSREACSTS